MSIYVYLSIYLSVYTCLSISIYASIYYVSIYIYHQASPQPRMQRAAACTNGAKWGGLVLEILVYI